VLTVVYPLSLSSTHKMWENRAGVIAGHVSPLANFRMVASVR